MTQKTGPPPRTPVSADPCGILPARVRFAGELGISRTCLDSKLPITRSKMTRGLLNHFGITQETTK